MISWKLAGLASALLLVLLAIPAIRAPSQRAVAFILPPTPPPAGVLIVVNTTSDLTNPGDGTCSLRAAISAANINGVAGNCSANGSHVGATDGIKFNIGTGTPTINVTSVLPNITDRLSIDGAGPADRVELHGPGTPDSGLYVTSSAPGTTIRHLVINNFGAGIVSEGASTKIQGSFIGTNKTGSGAESNGYDGMQILGQGDMVGGTSGVTPGGACTGDCNVISGNPQWGIFVGTGGNAVIEGNFIGTDVTGQSAIGNGWGIESNGPQLQIGGETPEARNVISGNGVGMEITQPTTVHGNYIGTNSAGNVALANGEGVHLMGDGMAVGGDTAGAGNVISGNDSRGIDGYSSTNVNIFGNFIGVAADGTAPLPNGAAGGYPGIEFRIDAHSDNIGGIGPGQGNVIADNATDGVIVCACGGSPSITIRGNSIFDNGGKGIALEPGANGGISAPVITSATYSSVSGTANCAYCTIDVYSDGGDQGRIYEGSVDLPINGIWQLTGVFHGPNLTATSTDGDGSGYGIHNTSEFSAPFPVPATPTPTPPPTPTPSPTLSATPTQSASPTPTAPPASATPTATRYPTPTHTPAAGLQGDANCDGDIDTEDALAILEEASQLRGACLQPAVFHWALADVNCDGSVNGFDVLDVLRHLAGDAELGLSTDCPRVGQSVLG